MTADSKNRMITFRVSEEEYERFRDVCLTHGLRSVSELARSAINMLVQQPDRMPQQALECRVAELEGRLRMLSLEFKRLNQTAHVTRLAAAAE